MRALQSSLHAFLSETQTQAASLEQSSAAETTPDFTALISGPATYGMALLLLSASIAILLELRMERDEF